MDFYFVLSYFITVIVVVIAIIVVFNGFFFVLSFFYHHHSSSSSPSSSSLSSLLFYVVVCFCYFFTYYPHGFLFCFMMVMQSAMWKVGVVSDMTGEKSPCVMHWVKGWEKQRNLDPWSQWWRNKTKISYGLSGRKLIDGYKEKKKWVGTLKGKIKC